jgi:hypothetical protein
VIAQDLVSLPEITAKMKGNQRWYTTDEGAFPSITTVLSAKAKNGIEQWKLRVGQEFAEKETKRCADRGTAVHLMCERFVQNHEKPTEGQQTPNISLFNRMKFALKHISSIYAVEAPLYSSVLRVAGRCDCVGVYKGVPSIIDYKTSNSHKPTEWIEDYFIQETFYSLAFFERTGIEIPQIVTIMASERDMLPRVWVREIKPYIKPLLSRIDLFYSKFSRT